MFKLAWRNIWRNRRRTGLTLMAIAFASAILVFFVGLQQSAFDTSVNANIAIFHGFLQVQRKGYLEEPKIRTSVSSAEQLRDEIAKSELVKASSVRAIGFGLISSAERTYGAQVIGVQVAHEGTVSTLPTLVREGSFLSTDTALEAVIGRDFAKNLKVSVGDELTVLGQGKDGSVAATVLRLVGIFESGSRDLDRNIVEIPLHTFQETFSLENEAHTIVVVGKDLRELPQLKSAVQAIANHSDEAKELVVHDWQELLPGLLQAINLDLAAHVIFRSALILIVVFSVLNTFLMSVLERTREFGVMLALGERPSQLFALIVVECGFLTILGVTLGVIFGGATILYYGIYGFYVPGSEQMMRLWGIPAAIYTRMSLRVLIVGPGVILLTSLLAVFLPAYRITKLEPVEAMRAT